jgi:hypothetical protein
MKVYIRKDKKINDFSSINFYNAYDGFKQLGAEILFYSNVKDIIDNNVEDIIVGGINEVRYILNKFNKTYPTLEYPESISKPQYLGRKI